MAYTQEQQIKECIHTHTQVKTYSFILFTQAFTVFDYVVFCLFLYLHIYFCTRGFGYHVQQGEQRKRSSQSCFETVIRIHQKDRFYSCLQTAIVMFSELQEKSYRCSVLKKRPELSSNYWAWRLFPV